MPTSSSINYSSTRVDPVINVDDATASQVPVRLKASTTFAAGTVIGEVGTTGVYGPYASGNVDGTQNPAGILQYGAVTDSSGNITNYSEWGATRLDSPMYTEGTFRTQDLTGLDANAVTKLGGHLLEGTVTTGLFKF